MTDWSRPATNPVIAEKTRCGAWEATTGISDSVPLMAGVPVSLAVTESKPAVLSVTAKVPTPLMRVSSAGKTAWPSELVKWTVPV